MNVHARDRRIAVYVDREFLNADEDRLSQMAECTPEAARMSQVKPGMSPACQAYFAGTLLVLMIAAVSYLFWTRV